MAVPPPVEQLNIDEREYLAENFVNKEWRYLKQLSSCIYNHFQAYQLLQCVLGDQGLT